MSMFKNLRGQEHYLYKKLGVVNFLRFFLLDFVSQASFFKNILEPDIDIETFNNF